MIVVCTEADDIHAQLLQEVASIEVKVWSPGGCSQFDLTGVQAIWVRHPQLYAAHGASQDWSARASFNEHKAIWQGLIAALPSNVLIVNSPWDVQRTDLKLPQLVVARSMFTVPEGHVMYSQEQLDNFIQAREGEWITKSLTHDNKLVYQGDETFMIVPQVVGEEIPFFPIYLQRRVPRVADLRVTRIGSQIFIHRLQSTLLEEDGVDSRESWGRESTRISREEDPTFANSVMTFFDNFGLPFGAADFIETPTGERVFLEANFLPDIHFLNDPELFAALARLLESSRAE